MKSKFEQFISEALKSPDKVDIQQSPNEYLNYQTEKVIKNTKNGLKIASSFIKMGIASSLIAGCALAGAGQLTTSKYQNEMKEVVTVAQQKGYLTAKIGIEIKEIKGNQRYDAIFTAENHADVLNKTSCDVTITLSETGNRLYLAHNDDIKQMTEPQNANQKKLSREFIILHETSHCEFENIKEVFVIKGNPELQKDVNYYFKNAYGAEASDSPYAILNENFADTYAAVQMLKIYGDTNDVKAVINQTSLERQDKDLSNTMSGKVDSHYTHFSLHEVLSKENLDKIKNTTDPIQLKQIALEIANKGTFTALSTYADALPSLFEQGSMIDSVMVSANNTSISRFLAAPKSKLNLSEQSTNTSFFQQLGIEVLQKIKVDRVSGINNQIEPLSRDELIKIREVSRDVFHARYGDEFEKIDSISDQFKKYIINNHKPVLEQKTDTTTTMDKLAVKRELMFKAHEIRTNELETMSSDKANVLKNIQSLRPDTSKTSTFSPS